MKNTFFLLALLFSLNAFTSEFNCDGVSLSYEEALRANEELKVTLPANSEEEFISKIEKWSITNYTMGGYMEINPKLRRDSLENVEFTALAMCSALNKREPYIGTVYRLSHLPIDVQAQYFVGNVVTEKAFTSTAMNEEGLRNYLNAFGQPAWITILDIFADKPVRNSKFYIKSLTGRDVSALSAVRAEREVLFPAGSKFRVTRVSKGKKQSRFWMEQVL